MRTRNTIIIKPFAALTLGEYHRIKQAREAVFYLEQHVTCPDADTIDTQSIFVWIEKAERVVAFLRIIPPGVAYSQASIGRVLVDAAHRRGGFCRQIMLEAMHYIDTKWSSHSICISAQAYLVPFYTSLGFEITSEEYLEAGIPHIKMLRSTAAVSEN